jgi:hypothetical protein
MLAFTNTIHTKPSAVALATWHQEQDVVEYTQGRELHIADHHKQMPN